MIRLKDTRHGNTSSFLNSAIKIAEYYGFSSLDDLERMPQTQEERKKIQARSESEISFARRDERSLPASAKKFVAYAKGRDALLAWRINTGSAGAPMMSLELHMVGMGSAIAEALLIIIGNAIAEDAGIEQRVLSINNIGSYESSNRFVRDIGTFLRKHLESITPTLRPRAAEDPLGTLVQLIEKGHPATPRAPQAMEYLTEEERRRFWELLEYLEVFGLPYELNGQILGSRDCWAHSLYEISTIDSESGERIPLAFGGRYDPLASRYSMSQTSAAMISINCETRGKTALKREHASMPGMPAIYFAHLGPDARRRSLPLLETLRRSDIRVHQGLHYDHIGDQMTIARQLAVPYILIMGHKEAMEGTVLVREVATNSQDAIPLPELPGYLKRRRVVPGTPTRHG